MARRSRSESAAIDELEDGFSIRREVLGFICLMIAAFYYLCLFSFDPRDPSPFSSAEQSIANLGGVLGSYLVGTFIALIGGGAYFLGLYFLIHAVLLFLKKREELRVIDFLAFLFCALFIAVFLDLQIQTLDYQGYLVNAGGIVGKILGEIGEHYLGYWGTFLIVGFGVILTFILATQLSFVETINTSTIVVGKGVGSISGQFFVMLARTKKLLGKWLLFFRGDQSEAHVDEPMAVAKPGRRRAKSVVLEDEESDDEESEDESDEDDEEYEDDEDEDESDDDEIEDDEDSDDDLEEDEAHSKGADIDRLMKSKNQEVPLIRKRSETKSEAKIKPVQLEVFDENYQLPSIDFLDHDDGKQVIIDEGSLKMSAKILEKKLKDFQIDGQVTEIHPGPVITMYEFQPAPGVKLSRIHSLTDDLSLAMGGRSVRIVAPLPNKAAVGIEIPNYERETVWLRDIIGDEKFQNHESKLVFALGKDIEGVPFVSDLKKMPHLLVAGSTGSGKSVAINSMICSMLYKARPDEVRMIMIDPKMIELSIYEGIPHLLLPVVTDSKKAHLALNWAVREMERRYQLLSDVNARNLSTYNKKIENGDIKTGVHSEAAMEAEGEIVIHTGKLPYIVVIVDEFADLMMVASKEVENAVCRLAQKARAAGIHVILATQRPSVDVITGIIKANFPSRISFKVTSKHDSRTIMDTVGAEHLLGNGDMLMMPPGSSAQIRAHGAYVAEHEISKIVDFLKAQAKPVYNEEILKPVAADGGAADDDPDGGDEFYSQAVEEVKKTKRVSISSIQRRFRIGYNRAARIVELMEQRNIVSAPNTQGQRQVLED